jgi:hypothetical protein
MKHKLTKQTIIIFLCIVLTIILLIPRQINTERFANKQIKDLNVACCLCVRNCEKFLPKIFDNLNRLSKEFTNFYVIFVYDNCTDNSGKLLQEYKERSDFKIIIKHIINESPHRTFRIAKARNTYVSILYNELPDIDVHFVIDSDDRNIKPWNMTIIKQYLTQNNWDALSFNRTDYYDIWALLYENIKHHCWGYESQSQKVVDYMRNDITKKLSNLDDHTLFTCLSAFNGFGIYKTPLFKNIAYDGEYKNIKTFISDKDINDSVEHLKKHNILDSDTASSTFAGFGEEHCEHLFYHLSAIKEKNARIRISKFIL